jgi:hypothetical protein
MKAEILAKYDGKLVRITTNGHRVLYGVLKQTGVYTFEIDGELLLAGSIINIKEVTPEEYKKWLEKKGIKNE